MRRLFILLLAVFGLAIGLTTSAGASTATVAPPAPPGMHLVQSQDMKFSPNSVSPAYRWCNGNNYCLNDSGSGCTESTWVIGWSSNPASNESLYYITQSSGWSQLHFQSCGNGWAIWRYGLGGSGNYLYMHETSATAANDNFGITSAGGNGWYFWGETDHYYLGVSSYGGHAYTSATIDTNSTWYAYSV